MKGLPVRELRNQKPALAGRLLEKWAKDYARFFEDFFAFFFVAFFLAAFFLAMFFLFFSDH
jgi:hypothetical protein